MIGSVMDSTVTATKPRATAASRIRKGVEDGMDVLLITNMKKLFNTIRKIVYKKIKKMCGSDDSKPKEF